MMKGFLGKQPHQLTDKDFIVKNCLVYHGMLPKIKDDAIRKILEEQDSPLRDFFARAKFLCCTKESAEKIVFTANMPSVAQIKAPKAIIVVKAREEKETEEGGFPTGIDKEVVFMEINKPILENLYNMCHEVFLPILGNPKNQQGLNDLVSKDLIEKFQSFLSHTYVTIGNVKGRTMLPLPPMDSPAQERQSSKEKAVILETALMHWTKQIKAELKKDPENALKNNNHPDPLTEVDFWKNKAENLNSICDQLGSEKIKKVLKFLEQNKSTQTSAFSKLQKEVQLARVEANENCKFLKTLYDRFCDLVDSNKELHEIAELFVPIMHTILLIWTYSNYYNTPARLLVLVREICNAVIIQCRRAVDGEYIFSAITGEKTPEAHAKLTQALDLCSQFKDAYFDYKGKSKNAWKITSNALFVRLDAFSERCQDIMQLTSTIVQFQKLDKIEIGNTKGKTLSASIKTIYEEFKAEVEQFMTVGYDIMDIEKREFDDDFFKFRTRIRELERRLAAVLSQSFDDCDTIIGKFKLLETFEGLLTRQIIAEELERKQVNLLELYKDDLKVVSQIFQEGKILIEKQDENGPISLNMPPVSGAINWTSGLYERIREPMERLQQLSQSIHDREEYKDIQKLYNSLCKNLREFEEEKIRDWEQGVEDNTEEQLKKFLLVREETDIAPEGFVRVNFDPILTAMLREVKYLQLLDIKVPERARTLYDKVDVYRSQTGNLDLIVEMYNNIIETLLPVEKPLMQKRIDDINKLLQPGMDTLKWNSEKIDAFIYDALRKVEVVDELVKKMKENVRQMVAKMDKWQVPLYERRPKTMPPDDVESLHSASVVARFEVIKQDGKDIAKNMKDTGDAIKPDKKGANWLAYVDYLNGLVIEGITNGINSSMLYLAQQISIPYNKQHGLQPIFDIKVSLQNNKVQYDPSIIANEEGTGIRNIINNITSHFISLAIQMPSRLDIQGGDYLVEIKDQFELFGTQQVISRNMNAIEAASETFLDQYDDFSFLYEEELEESFQNFLLSGPPLRETFIQKLKEEAPEDIEEEQLEIQIESFDAFVIKILNGVVTQHPDLEMFDEKITFLTEIKQKIAAIQALSDIAWIRVDSKPLIKDLERIIQDWIDKFTQFLLQSTTRRIQNMTDFINEVEDGIKEIPEQAETEKEKNLLKTVMTHLRDVNQVKEHALGLVLPMKETILLLKKHAVEMNADFLVLLENCKTDLIDVSDRALGPTKEQILPLQNKEANNVKERRKQFQSKVLDFRKEFQAALPYNVTDSSAEIIQQSYDTISEYYRKTVDIENESKELQHLETLFDLQRTNYKEIKDCKSELVQLKQMWDLIALIDGQFESWKKTLWDQIDAPNLEALIRDMQLKQVAHTLPINKEIKNFKAFGALVERVRNMKQLSPLIIQLNSKNMLDRHWKRLQIICSKTVPYNQPSFCLNDLIDMELHRFVDDVIELVDGASKEASIEKKLNGIISTWDDQRFEFKVYPEEGNTSYILGALDEIVEYVETQSLELMGLLASKDSEEFKEPLHKWQKILKTVDGVIQVWVKVQKNWMRLEPIFLQSEDIRAQLPEDTKRFEKVDIDWRELMNEVVDAPGVVECATADGRFELLEELYREIEICEKALNEYLEQKKKIFPRFYFVSNQALLDILSNGNNPEKVNEYLGDCFDGMKCVEFITGDNEPRPYRRSQGMFSKDGEHVKFGSEFVAQGAVESYLLDLEKKMQLTLKDELVRAKEATDEWNLDLPREKWLDDYCAQLALLATQIVFTEETFATFSDLESGSESAMKEYLVKIKGRIQKLIARVREDLTREIHTKVTTIITIDVHSRDVIEEFVHKKIMESSAYEWVKQLKFYLDYRHPKDEKKSVKAGICDWETWYNYEYIGNTGRLVITPLTDRCYITLTQALNLSMGGAPAGPAGTGKTETTKDLGRALGLQVVVFNCSEQMTYVSMALIFMGLSQSGAWGCFDEFNRIHISVLSVVSTQVKYCLDAVKEQKANANKTTFIFQDDEISLKLTVGFFITMNPGYAGRTELPENLKALFRSCAMVVPDIIIICENMLMAEGFEMAKDLSKKFMTLYELSKTLLSPQKHYDWGLRAVKSVLRQAGGLKRKSPDDSEYVILMKALRDFNLPKIVEEDQKIFLGLITDFFPNLNPPRSKDQALEEACIEACKRDNKQPEENFIKKCIEFSEILEVRHCMFIIGFPGAAKSTIWKILAEAKSSLDWSTIWDSVDPKSVTSDELFGFMNAKTKEWKDGVLSVMMRDMNKNQGKFKATHKYKWVVLDGDVDPNWIESLNTVMDDNKVLTLVSQERIPLTPEMRLIIEVSNLREATPATVSRGGVLFVNEGDVGWRPLFDTWINKYKNDKRDEVAATCFTLSLQTYLSDNVLEELSQKDKIAPACDLGMFESLTTIIDYLYDELSSGKEILEYIKHLRADEKGVEDLKSIYDGMFVYAMIWAFGGTIGEDKLWFSNMVRTASKTKFPEGGQVYDYYFDPMTVSFKPWAARVAPYDVEYDGLFANLVVPTAETARQSYMIDIHRKHNPRKGVLLIGIAGTGKTTVINNYFAAFDPEKTLASTINFNSYTDSYALQSVLVGKVEKRMGRIYGPPPGKELIFFMDDLNMPAVDKYGTQSPIALIRQIIDYGIVYDRNALEDKMQLIDIQFLACMNPKSGSYKVDLRMSRHFTQIALTVPEKEILITIYQQVLANHLKTFDQQNQNWGPKIVSATAVVFSSLANAPQFWPTALKFHYQFNMRDFANIIENLLLAQPSTYKGNVLGMVRMWAHECHRVWKDRLIFPEDREQYMNFMRQGMKEFPADFKEEQIFAEPLIYTSFITLSKGHEANYQAITEMDELKDVLEKEMEKYNEQVSSMDLVLFNQAMEHIARIARILNLPGGNALLVGVGGSGKQSLSKLASFILQYDVFRIVVSTSYTLNDLKTDMQTLFMKAGTMGMPTVFLLTEAQIPSEYFLVYINDILAAGYIPDLFAKEELDEIMGKIRNEAKQLGYLDTPDQLWEFFLEKIKRNLHVDLCFSPVGEQFRVRARRFPGLINDTQIDWFHEWPEEALLSVSSRFLAEIEFPSEETMTSVSQMMANVHLSIEGANKEFKERERRYNYTTPTSFLELINFYKRLLTVKRDKIQDDINRLERGLSIMVDTNERVAVLKKELDVKMQDVEIEKEKTNILIEEVGRESNIAEAEEAAAKQQEEATMAVANEAQQMKADADKELEEAVPAMEAAKKAVDCLTNKAIVEFKSYQTPPKDADQVTNAVLIMLGEKNKNKLTWGAGQKMMNQPQKFIERLQSYDKNNIPDQALNDLKPILDQPFFNEQTMKGKSEAAANLCSFVVNVINYNRIWRKVKPLMEGAEAAETTANEKLEELRVVQERVAEIVAKVEQLRANLQAAQDKKDQVVGEATKLQQNLDLAERLVSGLAEENVRWQNNVKAFKEEKHLLIGNVLVSSAFVSYIGPFSSGFRTQLWQEQWLAEMVKLQIPLQEGVDPLAVLSSKSDQAKWQTQGLPADRVSLENAAIVVSCTRYPLLIDPQLQGIKWIKGRERGEMVSLQLSQKNWMKKVEIAVSSGQVLMIDSIGQEIDAVLDPLLSRQFVNRNNKKYVKLGAEEIEVLNTFKLYLQTKLINPHYKPETAAQCTIINFIVTEQGLEDQLLALVVKSEKPELEATKEQLTEQSNQYMIQLYELEANLLTKLTDADPNTILENIALIEQLESTKEKSMSIQEAQITGRKTEEEINTAREIYRPVAAEGALLYFLLIQLYIVDNMYQYSLDSFTTFFFKAIDKTKECETEEERVEELRTMIRMTIYQWVSRGLFEQHKQILLVQMTFRLMEKGVINVNFTPQQMSFLINSPMNTAIPNPLKRWLPDAYWYSIQKLIEIEPFENFSTNLVKDAPKRFEDWYNTLDPEERTLPLDWRSLDQQPFQKLLVVRVLRPDRCTMALSNFVRRNLPRGNEFVDCDSTSSSLQVLQSAHADSGPTTPIFFILSPGANPVKDVEALARKNGVDPNKALHQVALGQGQDTVANQKLEIAHKEGHWVMLQNVHLMPDYLKELEKKLALFAIEGSDPNFRLFLSSDPAPPDPITGQDVIPIGILERSIKLTNEPPSGLKANMKRAFTFFIREEFEDKEGKVKTILFALCYFHSMMLERKKFGSKGFNMQYAFNIGDLRDSAIVLQNYLEGNTGKVPWPDLIYIFGEIMYGGHIVNDLDRRFCTGFLTNLMQENLFDEANMFPFTDGTPVQFKAPAVTSYDKYLDYIDSELPPESPVAFGMHPNAEIDYRYTQCKNLFRILIELQPKDAGASGEGQETVGSKVADFQARVADDASLDQNKINVEDITSKLTDETRGPYQNVFIQEIEQINVLINQILRSLFEIELANKGELTMSEDMENLMNEIYMNKVPAKWMKVSFETTRSLGPWLDNIKHRLDQLNAWKETPDKEPQVTFINRLYNPTSFLTAVKQVMSREKSLELNKLFIQTEIQKKMYWETADLAKREGAFVFGLQVDGARWDTNSGLEECEPKKPYSIVPVVLCRPVPIVDGKKEEKGVYQCPVYKTEIRGNTYVFTAQLKTKHPPMKWVLAGAAMILDVEGVSDAFQPGKEVAS